MSKNIILLNGRHKKPAKPEPTAAQMEMAELLSAFELMAQKNNNALVRIKERYKALPAAISEHLHAECDAVATDNGFYVPLVTVIEFIKGYKL